MRESHSNSLQLLTQGTADIVLDCCDDFWDGKDLRPLTSQERKRAQDFYQRSALTAYCTAFAYRPLRHSITGALAGGTFFVYFLCGQKINSSFFCTSYSKYWQYRIFGTSTRIKISNGCTYCIKSICIRYT